MELVNELREVIHEASPFAAEPVDFVKWVPADLVVANDYNPNTVAPPEMVLLERSIVEDGFTQPIVTWVNGGTTHEVIDGFHRNRIGRESLEVAARIKGWLPVTIANEHRTGRGDRIAATIRHNRARGKHQVEAMSDIVVELKRRNWPDVKIARELGMDQDEILRLCQITGLAELFTDQEFSKAWDVEGAISEDDLVLSDDVADYAQADFGRTVNTSDPDRIFHTHEKWECYVAGFYESAKTGVSRAQGEEMYRVFLSDKTRFTSALEHVITEWKYSCEHYLTNVAMNRVAWLGQASMCYETGIPAAYRSGFHLLSAEQQLAADKLALKYLNKWLKANGRKRVTMDAAIGYERQVDIY
jgi:ParB-like chromosome segregation protein Spo0J